jgi:predicted O-linked N-acetylglucosamine transferase (SPINDLY family)
LKPGRNDPCPCGSGKKYKSCCIDKAPPQAGGPTDYVSARVQGRRSIPETLQAIQQHLAAGRVSEAAALTWQVIELQPSNLDLLNTVGGFAFNSNQFVLAAQIMERAGALHPTRALFPRNHGLALESLGRRADAIRSYRRAVTLDAGYLDAHADLGSALFHEGQVDEAITVLRKALSIDPKNAEVHNTLGMALQQRGQLQEAANEYQAALASRPDHASAHNNLGTLLETSGNVDGAVASYQRALERNPNDADTWMNLGNALLRQRRGGDAIAAFRRVVELRPGYAEAWFNLGSVLDATGQLEAAEAHFRRAAAINPEYADAWASLGLVLWNRGASRDAEAPLRRAIDLNPKIAFAHNCLGAIAREKGRLDEAAACFEQALDIEPNRADAWANLGLNVREYAALPEAQSHMRRALSLRPDPELHSNLLFTLNYDATVDDATLFAEHRAWEGLYAPPRPRSTYEGDRDPERRLRIGYVSNDFVQHPVGFMLAAIFPARDREKFEVVCYSGYPSEDAFTERLKAASDLWRRTVAVSDDQLERMIRDDRIDILVDLSGHTAGGRLTVFARRPAPLQVSWLGYFATTGLSTIDYVLMDEHVVPPGAEQWFTEKVVRLPVSRFCYTLPDYAPEPAPPPSLTRGYPTFGSFNNLSKVTPEVFKVWSDVLEAAPDSKLVLKWRTLRNEPFRKRIHDTFASHGVDPQRVELRAETPHGQMLAEYGDIDVALDPFPFSGGMTSLEALSMGVPVVTLPGTRTVSRQTHGFVSAMGLERLSCKDPESYVATAVALAKDVEGLKTLRTELRGRIASSALGDGPAFMRNLETTLRELWRTASSSR